MKNQDVVNLLNKIDQIFLNYINEVEDRKDRRNESYYNGYQAACDDIHSVIQDQIQDLLIEDS